MSCVVNEFQHKALLHVNMLQSSAPSASGLLMEQGVVFYPLGTIIVYSVCWLTWISSFHCGSADAYILCGFSVGQLG